MEQIENSMLYVDGSKTAMRCECGCNVFHRIIEQPGNTYECNSCGEWYSDWLGDHDPIVAEPAAATADAAQAVSERDSVTADIEASKAHGVKFNEWTPERRATAEANQD